MTAPLIRTPEDICCHCRAEIYFQGMWRHLSSLLSACDNGRTNAQPANGSRWTPPDECAQVERCRFDPRCPFWVTCERHVHGPDCGGCIE